MQNSLAEMSSLNRALSKNSWTTYREILGRLCRAHSSKIPLPGFENSLTTLLSSEDVDGLIDLADVLGQQSYASPQEHHAAHQFANLIKKYPFDLRKTKHRPEEKALETFREAEQNCARMNEWFAGNPFMERDLHKARDFIRYVLGEYPPLQKIYQLCGFSAGASLGVHGDATSLNRKIGCESYTVTAGAFHYAAAAARGDALWLEAIKGFNEDVFDVRAAGTFYSWFQRHCSVVRHNKIAFVPKTAKTHRSIAVEPLLNGYVQKGVDLYLRGLLRNQDIDLKDQTRNQIYARFGSEDWESPDGFVTIDLKSASDSISYGLAKWMLPPAWFDFLNAIRSKEYMLPGTTTSVAYQKFCSMGNGFCFPLETLIFMSVCKAVGGVARRDFVVYGDDIIVRKSRAAEVIRLLGIIGFTTNKDKTFVEGPFRESCGADYFGGVDVRPFVLDFELDSLEALFKFSNLTRRNALTMRFFDAVRDYIVRHIPKRLKFVRPYDGPSDTAITVEIDSFMASPFAQWDRNTQTWTWMELLRGPVSDSFGTAGARSTGILMSALVRGFPSRNTFTYRRKTVTTVRRCPDVRPTHRKRRVDASSGSASQDVPHILRVWMNYR